MAIKLFHTPSEVTSSKTRNFAGLTDGTGAYNVLRTLMYEYCRRRYDGSLSSNGIRKVGETIDESEWIDPASLPKPELHALPVPPLPKAINLITDTVCPLRERYEVINILVAEQQLIPAPRLNGHYCPIYLMNSAGPVV